MLTEIVALGDSVLVGYRGGWGSWLTADPDAAVVRVRTGLRDVGGQIFLPELVQDARAMELLYRWCEQETPLVSVVSRGRRLELRDPSGRHAVVAELSLTR